MIKKYLVLFSIVVVLLGYFSESLANNDFEIKKALLQERLARLQAEFALTQEQLKQLESQQKTAELESKKDIKKDVNQE